MGQMKLVWLWVTIISSSSPSVLSASLSAWRPSRGGKGKLVSLAALMCEGQEWMGGRRLTDFQGLFGVHPCARVHINSSAGGEGALPMFGKEINLEQWNNFFRVTENDSAGEDCSVIRNVALESEGLDYLCHFQLWDLGLARSCFLTSLLYNFIAKIKRWRISCAFAQFLAQRHIQ